MANKRIKVLRPFMLSGKPTKLNDEMELPASLVADLVCSGKAAIVPPPAPVEIKAEQKVEPVKKYAALPQKETK